MNKPKFSLPTVQWRPVLTTLCATLAVAGLLTIQAGAQTDPVVAKVNGTEVKESDLKAAEEDIGAQLPPMAPEAKKEYLTTYVADMLLVSKAAEAKKLGDTPEFKKKMELARTKLLMEALLQNEAKAALTDDAMKKVYAEATKDMGNEQEVSARHILVESEDDAKKIAADLKKGGDFSAIAKEKSKDPGSKDNGGDLGFFSKDQMVPEFAEAAFKLDKGQVSDPVKSQFGWHVIRVDDKRTKQPPTFEQVKDQIESFVQRKAQADLIQKLRAEAKIEKIGDADPAAKPDAAPAAKPDAKSDTKAPAKK
ncbi:peptidylprolyl isomerase [Pseudorhodoplanes sinuspersici]|uniref:Parvulin-like PPIase n=1 Tax=Pseudorhodoplanes sinuspersici TaxID=1235591 RepID=A0A1W6ZQD4_9HYPH|nr:peptidylprolyl isomerase [Pseudorhodoplanes sinuspersici]ARP99457.1 peptidylprolyl isomerase [Pseudorhodoplanes sinuspersici]RKE70406.1 peptidyl-prolyl cis-trans isomerase C [Pseudorhodoplanes sinuspersici]